MKTEPLVSIMMTTYNRAELISEAIESVLLQTYQNWEMIILDDASTDNTRDVIERWLDKDARIIYLPSSINLGISKNRNRGFLTSQGKYIAVLDSDDFWIDPKKLTRQVDFLEKNPEYVVVGTNVAVVYDTTNTPTAEFIYTTNDGEIRSRLLWRNQFTHSSVLIRRQILDDKPYDESLPIWEDYDLILRLGQKGKLANLPYKMTAYRRHSANISKTARHNGARVHLSIIRKYRNNYPNYLLARIKGWLRLVF